MSQFDIIVIGGGSAGFAAARSLGGHGLKVGLVEKGPLGGLCILRGCMPTKTLLRSTEVLQLARDARELGLDIPSVTADFPAIMARKRELVKGFQTYRIEGIHRAPFTLIEGEARFTGPQNIAVGDRSYAAEKFLIATGSMPQVPSVPGLAEVGYLTSDEALELQALPKSMIVWGGGVIALELGQFFARLGVHVTMIRRGAHVLTPEDSDVQEGMEAILKEEGLRLVGHVNPQRFERRNGLKVLHATVEDRLESFEAEEILVATGRVPSLDSLNLVQAGVRTEQGRIQVDAEMRTSNPRIYAAGDCLGDYYLVHVAIQQAEVAAHNMRGVGPSRQADYRLLASAIFTDPHYARVGLSEREAAARGLRVVVGKYEFADLGKAECMGKLAMRGFVKLIALQDSGEIVGAQILGPEGADLIHELIVAMEFRCTAERLMQIPHLHPTLAEIITYPAEEIAEKRAELRTP